MSLNGLRMIALRPVARIATAAFCAGIAASAHGYSFVGEPPATRFVMNLDLGSGLVYTTGYGTTQWSQLAQKAIDAWNQAGIGPQQDHVFLTTRTPAVAGSACARDGVNEVAFAQTMCGLAFGSALAVTRKWTLNGERVEEDVIFDSRRYWDAYRGPLRTRPDFYRVALHELGHVIGLDHPDDDGQTRQALMNSAINNYDVPQDDDLRGLHFVNWRWLEFPTRYSATPNTAVASDAITVTGTSGPAIISVVGGEYSINGGAYTSAPGTVTNGQSVAVRVTSSASAMTATTAVLTIGEAQAPFTAITTDGASPITVAMSPFGPLSDGSYATVAMEGNADSGSETVTIQPGTVSINGIATKARASADGRIAYVTNDAQGLRTHRSFTPKAYIKGYGYVAVTMTMNPPALDAPASATLGQTYRSSGTVNYSIPALGIDVNLSYESESAPEGFERITIPLGTFDTVRHSVKLRVYGDIEGDSVDRTVVGLEWLVAGMGAVKAISDSDHIETETLTATNLRPTGNLASNWNMLGNGGTVPLNVAAAFGDADRIASVWKWQPTARAWAFFTPSLGAQALAEYAASKGYGVLATVEPGEGYWVNAKQPLPFPPSGAAAVTASALRATLGSGWSLLAIGETMTPKEFNVAIGDAPAMPPPTNLVTLWAWDAASSRWYFYAPNLDAAGTLTSYIAGKGYLDFAAGAKTLGPNVGFWINRP